MAGRPGLHEFSCLLTSDNARSCRNETAHQAPYWMFREPKHCDLRSSVNARNVRSVVMTGDISIRTARAADYEAIIAVVDDWWGRPVHHALPRLFLDHFHDTSLIAERSGGELAGFLVGFGSPGQRDCAYIQFAGVAPGERRSGLGRLLYRSFFEAAAKDGRRVVRAVTAPVNKASIAFHAAMGFAVTGPVDGYDGPSSAKVLFERQLD